MTEVIPPSASMNPIELTTESSLLALSATRHQRRRLAEELDWLACARSGRLPNHPLRGDDPTTREPHTDESHSELWCTARGRTTSGP